MDQSDLFLPYDGVKIAQSSALKRSVDFYNFMNQRRSVRMFSSEFVPKEIIENIIRTASTAPSGANKQPWKFHAIANPVLKKKIREAAEAEEYKNYNGRMNEEWLDDLKVFGTDWHKEFLEIAPWLIVVSRVIYNDENGARSSNYYINESVGIATGFLLSAIHDAGLVALTHTPSPMGFLMKTLERPENERAFLLIPVGYASGDAKVPNIKRKELPEIAVFYE